MYHSVGGHPTSGSLAGYAHSREEFAEQLDALAAHGFCTVTAEQVARATRGTKQLPARAVALTFDDAFTDFVDSVLPELTARGMVATLFVPTAFIGDRARWLDSIGEGERTVLGPDAIRAVHVSGIECGAHSRTHLELDRVRSTRRLAAEIHTARVELEDLLSAGVSTFAYPFGYHSQRARHAVAQAGYLGGLAVSERQSRVSTDDPFALPRLRVHRRLRDEEFIRLLTRRRGHCSDAYAEAKRLGWRWMRRAGVAR
jgi:peptidoglycan/xylan/chitin deacetylase (PgdA/CDA1 family)